MNELKRRHLGIAGSLIVVAQGAMSFHSSQTISDRIEELQQEIQESKVEREQFFVRKTEMAVVSHKLETMNEELIKINNQVISLKSFIKSQFEYDITSDEVSCFYGDAILRGRI